MKNFTYKLFDISNKKIIVIGSSRGIGLKICKSLESSGAKVFGISRTKINKKNYYSCDASVYSEIELIFKKIFKKNGKIDCLINAAAITNTFKDNFYKKKLDFNKILNTNILSYYNPILLCNKYMKNNGSIVNITSIAAHIGISNNFAYSASKGGIKQMAKSLAIDYYEKKKIRINNIAPGYIKTQMTKESYKDIKRNRIIKNRNIMKRWGETKDLVGPVIFLCSNASNFITGTDIIVDGGFITKGL